MTEDLDKKVVQLTLNFQGDGEYLIQIRSGSLLRFKKIKKVKE